MYFTGFLGSGVIFILSTSLLIVTYYFIFSIVVLWLSFVFNGYYLQFSTHTLEQDNVIEFTTWQPRYVIAGSLVQLTLAYFYNSWRSELPLNQHPYTGITIISLFRRGTCMYFLIVIISHALTLPPAILEWMPLVSVLILIAELTLTLLSQWLLTRVLYRGYLMMRYMIRTYGIQNFMELQWTRLHVPQVLRLFWMTRVSYHLVFLVVLKVSTKLEADKEGVFTFEDAREIASELLVSSCETVVALLGMTSVISFITHHVGFLLACFIGSDNEEDRNMGTVSAILFFVLALQTGLTGLDPDKRLIRLYRNFCLLATAMLHFVHSMVNPLLMSLSAQRNTSVSRHARVLLMCACLVSVPCLFLTYLWSRHPLSTWLLAVTAFSIEVVIKVIISLLVYILFMIDAFRETFWEKLDDYVYYIKSTGNTIEFIFGIFLFCNGAWIMVFESGGTIRAIMMCIHAYFNIWMQAKEGWKVFMNRRTAVKKINSLPQATRTQLTAHNDVCAICYQELNTARITRCKHYFHGVCLRKWLYVQDNCPLCHELIYQPESPDGATVSQDQNEAAADDSAHQEQGHNDPNQNQLIHQQEQEQMDPLHHGNNTNHVVSSVQSNGAERNSPEHHEHQD